MQAIDLMLFFAIASMVWGLQYANQSTMGSQAREVNTNSNAEEALNFVRAVQRGGTTDKLSGRRLQGYRDAVNQSQERIDCDATSIDSSINALEKSSRNRTRLVDRLDNQNTKIVAFSDDIHSLTELLQEVNETLRSETERARVEKIAVENRIRDLESRFRNTAHEVEEVRGWMRL